MHRDDLASTDGKEAMHVCADGVECGDETNGKWSPNLVVQEA